MNQDEDAKAGCSMNVADEAMQWVQNAYRGGTFTVWNMQAAYCAGHAQGMEARSGETEGLDPKGDSAVGAADAPNNRSTPGSAPTGEALTDLIDAADSILDAMDGVEQAERDAVDQTVEQIEAVDSASDYLRECSVTLRAAVDRAAIAAFSTHPIKQWTASSPREES